MVVKVHCSHIARYAESLREIDRFFESVLAGHAGQMKCCCGCSLCCHGLFDISLPDALAVAEAVGGLPALALEQVKIRAAEIQARILEHALQLKPPYFLDTLTEEAIDRIAEQVGRVRCPFLDERDKCLIYERRPLACRLEGLPMVDAEDGPFSDWCELNFTKGLAKADLKDLEFDYHRLQEIEDQASQAASEFLLGHGRPDITLFIASLVVELDYFRKRMFPGAATLERNRYETRHAKADHDLRRGERGTG